ncbi:hypothetical protein ABPG72_015955 [Tetrahymena utriculariae]
MEVKLAKEYEQNYQIPQIKNIEVQGKLDKHIQENRSSIFYNLFLFILLIEFSSEGLQVVYLYPESQPFQQPIYGNKSISSTQYTLIHIILSSSGFIFGIFSGYVNDFVKRKYSFMIYLVPYYTIIIMQVCLMIQYIYYDQSYYIIGNNDEANMKQIVLIIEFFWHMIQDGYKVVIYLIILDYFLNYKYYFYFALIIVAQQDFSYSLQIGVYSFVVYFQNNNFYTEYYEPDNNNIQNAPILSSTSRIILLVFYLTASICSIIPFRRLLHTLEEKHSIEEQDEELLNYNILGANKQNVFDNFSYLINKKTYIVYVIIFIIFYQTSLFQWISTYQNSFFLDYAIKLNINNVLIPINNILNPIFSIIFTICLANKFKDETNPFGLQLDQKLRLSCTAIQIFNFFMLIANSCRSKECQDGLIGNSILEIFLSVMYICSSFIGTASNFLLMCSILKIAEIFNVRSKVLGSAFSIYISALYGFEVIDYLMYNYPSSSSFSTILYSVYFALNSLSLFAMIIIHSKYHKTVKVH